LKNKEILLAEKNKVLRGGCFYLCILLTHCRCPVFSLLSFVACFFLNLSSSLNYFQYSQNLPRFSGPVSSFHNFPQFHSALCPHPQIIFSTQFNHFRIFPKLLRLGITMSLIPSFSSRNYFQNLEKLFPH
jgi:hypothetical protein